MAKFILRKIGEGTRERKPSKFGEGGRPVGGMARVNENKGHLSKPAKSANKKQKLEFPRPGGHPQDLTDKAEARGLTPPLAEESGDLDLDKLFAGRHEDPRPTRTRAERASLLEEKRTRLPILYEEPAPLPEAPPADPRQLTLPGMGGPAQPPSTAITATPQTPEGRKAALTKTAYTQKQAEEIAAILGTPGVTCNRCPAAESCPEFKPNAACAYDDTFAGLTNRDTANVLPNLESFADLQQMRARRAVFLEQRVTGGQLDPAVTRQIAVAMEAAEKVARLKGQFAPEAPNAPAPQQAAEQAIGIIASLMQRKPSTPTQPIINTTAEKVIT